MRSLLKFVIGGLAIYLTYMALTGQPLPNVSAQIPSPSASLSAREQMESEGWTETDQKFDQIFSNTELEMLLRTASEQSFPLSNPQVTLAKDGSFQLSCTVDLNKTVEQYNTPAIVQKVASLGLFKGQVPLYVKGTIREQAGALHFTPQETKVGGVSITTLERTTGLKLLSDEKNLKDIDTAINDGLRTALKVEVTDIEYGNGFVRIKGTKWVNPNATPVVTDQ